MATVKIEQIGAAEYEPSGKSSMLYIRIPGERFGLSNPVDPQLVATGELVRLESFIGKMAKTDKTKGVFLFRGSLYRMRGIGGLSRDEITLHLKHWILQQDKTLHRIKKELEAFENLERVSSARRELIPESIRLFVWQRDGGKCAKCGSNEKLEFDHIIPIARGGSSTERNVQLLCERCNREKGSRI